ncbi:MAG TPA: anthranilate phosphoribosyltransferase [Myxococcales bacterium]|nr:anthranilate phosphoribosyltransferase [Myxococcales bacterium]
MSHLAQCLQAFSQGERPTGDAISGAFDQLMDGDAPDAAIGGFLMGLAALGERPSDIAAGARVLRGRMQTITAPDGAIDTCGTGGDRSGTFNISTTAAIVVAACGVKVAKHGNRAVSSQSGSADVLEALGVKLEGDPAAALASLARLGLAFLFAPAFHGALKHAAPVRRELGLRTFFNLLGPLANPASASHQLLGVYDPKRLRQIAEVLGSLGVRGAWVVHGEGGLDEVSPCGPTHVAILKDGAVEETTVEPGDFGLEAVAFEGLVGGDARANADIIGAVLDGAAGAPRVAVVINAAAALLAAGAERDPKSARQRVEEAIDAGRARDLLARWVGA